MYENKVISVTKEGFKTKRIIKKASFSSESYSREREEFQKLDLGLWLKEEKSCWPE